MEASCTYVDSKSMIRYLEHKHKLLKLIKDKLLVIASSIRKIHHGLRRGWDRDSVTWLNPKGLDPMMERK
jgi:hypothetical protein